MAKKKTARKARPTSVETSYKFDDEKYEGLRFSATYDYGELALSKAASYLGGQKARIASFVVSMACLALMIVVLIADSHNMAPAIVLLVLSMGGTAVSTNWHNMQLNYARNSSLGFKGTSSRRHVVVTGDAVYVADESGAEERYDLSDLRSVSADDDGLLAGFGARRYAYVPSAAMSASRFRELSRELEAARS